MNPFTLPKCALKLKLSNFKNHKLLATYIVAWNLWVYGVHSFPGLSLALSAWTFLSFMAITFIFHKSTFLCILVNSRVPVVMCTLSSARILMIGAWDLLYICVIGPGKIGLFCKIHFHGYYSWTSSTEELA